MFYIKQNFNEHSSHKISCINLFPRRLSKDQLNRLRFPVPADLNQFTKCIIDAQVYSIYHGLLFWKEVGPIAFKTFTKYVHCFFVYNTNFFRWFLSILETLFFCCATFMKSMLMCLSVVYIVNFNGLVRLDLILAAWVRSFCLF